MDVASWDEVPSQGTAVGTTWCWAWSVGVTATRILQLAGCPWLLSEVY